MPKERISMSKLKDAERSEYCALLKKYGRDETKFELNEHNVRRSADGRLRGIFWIVHVSLSAGAHGPVCVLEPQKSKAS